MNVGSLAGSLFLNFTLSCLSEVPAGFVIGLLTDRVGIRRLNQFFLGLLGLACCGLAFVPKHDNPGLVLGLFLVGKASATIGVNSAWMYTTELYPTNLRQDFHD